MPDFLNHALFTGPTLQPLEVLTRLVTALALGALVAWIYRRTRRPADRAGSFPMTLVLLAVLIAMVTQVIGDNVARAFSLVGALSIVRFRTVVRDTEDTAYVIFAVAVGMAVGASNLWVAALGLAVIGLAAFVRRWRPDTLPDSAPLYLLNLRVGLGHDLNQLLAPVFAGQVIGRELLSIETARQGTALDVSYRAQLPATSSAEILVMALNRVEGVQSVRLQRCGAEPD